MFSGFARHVRQHLVGYLALFVALGGTSYAAVTKLLPANSVGTRQVINKSLRTADFSKGAIATLHGRQGAQGPKGDTGPGGPQGSKGDTGPAGSTVIARTRGGTQSTNGATSMATATPWALTGNGWVQGAT